MLQLTRYFETTPKLAFADSVLTISGDLADLKRFKGSPDPFAYFELVVETGPKAVLEKATIMYISEADPLDAWLDMIVRRDFSEWTDWTIWDLPVWIEAEMGAIGIVALGHGKKADFPDHLLECLPTITRDMVEIHG